MSPAPSKRVQQRQELDKDEPDFGDSHEDFDQIYRQHEESALGDVQQQHGNVLTHFLSQVCQLLVETALHHSNVLGQHWNGSY